MNNSKISFSHTRLGSKNKILLAFLGFILLSSLTPLQSINAASVIIPASPVNLSDFASTDSKTPDIASSGDNVYVVVPELPSGKVTSPIEITVSSASIVPCP